MANNTGIQLSQQELLDQAIIDETPETEFRVFKPTSLEEIKRLVAGIISSYTMPSRHNSKITIGGKIYQVNSDSDAIKTMIDNLSSIKRIIENKGKSLFEDIGGIATPSVETSGMHAIDPIIECELGAVRVGHRVMWELDDRKVFFDFTTNKMTQILK